MSQNAQETRRLELFQLSSSWEIEELLHPTMLCFPTGQKCLEMKAQGFLQIPGTKCFASPGIHHHFTPLLLIHHSPLLQLGRWHRRYHIILVGENLAEHSPVSVVCFISSLVEIECLNLFSFALSQFYCVLWGEVLSCYIYFSLPRPSLWP